ncbi:aminotransferase class V-fold PLP-dependent enzyme [Agrobacterium vitis]|uniref:cysteine desulfurase family protein n=1 Tax=Rhizobium/Agrobacterium group TaxID=227290 RepID=UPI0012E96730|nr:MULTISPECIES: cysteine desulfurase family protein [Rhizobium/Agrobacterium group]MCF1435114.1 cysteine desulfurase [Allorhizobium ampelinum]MUO90521.1 aminotransferase class V-fold PLP-dependent enzyme [Agrobacterium vitis]MUZ52943.1 aminotransferase class V-fold PLP-dependent enzyme [Agrobacterium vitis]MUZ91162.1 aminotransferase class V-fold PLP-dependent enzyme [Agrobacterium vitis]MVA40395.1 aminotransferase class V-fold PLP-dependent enzyme [Agrobacterium vitis]
MAERIYMDWNATAPLLNEARDAMLAALAMPGNPSSVHAEGRTARALVEKARRQVADLVGAAPANVIFTSTATEAANFVLSPHYRMGRSLLAVGRAYVSAIEHPAVRQGGRFSPDCVTEITVTRQGVVDLDALERALADHPADQGMPLVAVMLANNETGVIQPVEAVGKLVHAKGGLLLVDAVQAVGRIPVDITSLDADFLILSAHKLGGPKGAGAVVARGEALMPEPLVRGGGQEKGHRGGTENLVAIAGFGAAADHATKDLINRNLQIAALRDALETGMRSMAPDLVIHGAGEKRIGNTSFVTLPGLKAETGQIAFDLEGVALSAGAACSSGKVGQSHVLTAMGVDAGIGGLRLSLGPATTAQDIERVVSIFGKIAVRRQLAGHAA